MGLELAAVDPHAPLPRAVLMTVTCDTEGCRGRFAEAGFSLIAFRRVLTRRGWVERADCTFRCPLCRNPAQGRLL